MQFESPQQEQRIQNTDPREQQQYAYGAASAPDGGQKIYPTPPLPRQRRRSWLAGPLGIIVLLVLAWSLLHTSLLFSQTRVADHSFALSGHTTLVINSGSGDIHIHSGSTNAVTVRSTEHAYGLDQPADPSYSQNGSTITLGSNDTWNVLGQHSVDFDITVPNAIDVSIDDGSGNVDLSDVQGNTIVKVGSGDVKLDDVQGDTTVKTGSGDIAVQGLSGQANLSSGSGNIEVEQGSLSGQARLETGSGDINYTGSLGSAGNYSFKSGSGDVVLGLPSGGAFQFTTSTGSGDIHNAFGNATTDTNSAAVSITTGSGDITVNAQ